MNVVVPYTALRPETRAAVEPYAPMLSWVGWSQTAYASLLETLWEEGESFIVVEHDVVPSPGVIEAMWACERDWCAVEYRCGDLLMTALGCTKFSAALQARNPDAISRIQNRTWFNLDGQIVHTLHTHGEAEHIHYPVARHLKYDRMDALAEPSPLRRRNDRRMKLLYVGDGRRYLNGVPAADHESDDPEHIAIALESGLYIEAKAAKKKANVVAAEDVLPPPNDDVGGQAPDGAE